MKTTEISKTKIQEKREELKGLSAPIRALVKQGALHTINEGLKQVYAMQGHSELRTLRQWNSEGKRVKKGEKALLLWGTPKKYKVANADTSKMDELDYFPLCFVFSNLQVIEKGGAQ